MMDFKYPPLMKIHIDSEKHKPIALKPYKIPPAQIKWLNKQIDKWLKAGIINSINPLSSPVVLINQKEGRLRL